jgi:tRNA(Phe) wybutosine-synthesizing methylase Tyw3
MDVPVAEDGRLLVSEDYIKLLVKIANDKFGKGREKLERLSSEIKKI